MPPQVLVVEDYADLRSAIVSALMREHYHCASVATSEEAVAWLKTHECAAILLSARLPIVEDPVIRYLNADRPADIEKVIVMSDPATPCAPCELLEKPFTNAELVARLSARG
jgi:DNA-binding response OmpR family regulator